MRTRRFIVTFSLVTLCLLCVVSTPADRSRLRASLKSLEERARSGDPKSLYDLAVIYETGFDSISPDTLLSIDLYRRSADKGYPPAMNYYGFLLYNGVEGKLTADRDSAVSLLEKAAGLGDAKAANNLGWLTLQTGDTTRLAEAAAWFEKAADAGLPTAMAQLADMLRKGEGMKPDTLRAESLYLEALEHGLPDAGDKLLAMMYPVYLRMDPVEALAKGLRLYNGNAPAAGLTIFEIIVQKSPDTPSHSRALALMGDAYSRGRGTGYDRDKSLSCLLQSAREGYAPAQFILAEFLDFFPDALGPDAGTAGEWHQKATARGVSDSEKAMSLLLDETKIP